MHKRILSSIFLTAKVSFALILLLLSLAACTGAEAQTPPPASPTAVTATLSPTATTVLQPTPIPATEQAAPTATSEPPAPQVPPVSAQYLLDTVLDYDAHQVQVDETITYTNHSPEPITNLVLVVEPQLYPGTFNLESINLDGASIKKFEQVKNQIQFDLPQPVLPSLQVQVKILYTLNLPSPQPSDLTRPVPFGYTERQTNLVDWYPFVPPYLPGKGWLAHPAGYYGEHLVYDIANFRVNLRLATPDNRVIIAASSPGQADGSSTHYEMENARNFALSASRDYQVITKTVGSVNIIGYHFPVHAAAGQAALQTTAESLELYNRLFGAYPRTMLSVVEADFLDGMEYDGLYFLSNGFYNLYKGNPGEYLIAIAAHETAHQWWYGLLANDQAMEPWLDEALCTYSERLYYENVHPEALAWWWDYRVKYYNPRGWVDDSIYNPHGETEAYRAYRDAVYLNGAMFLEELRQLIGDQSFFAFLLDYVQQGSYKIITADDFFTILKRHTNLDSSGLQKKYFYRYQSP
jgi:hypothetical protein